jgi:hypothetical protein
MANDFRVDWLDEQEVGVKMPHVDEPQGIGVARADRYVCPEPGLTHLPQNFGAVAIRELQVKNQTVGFESVLQ